MKKQGSLILLILTLVFGSFSLGFFLGRNYSGSSVQVSTIPSTTAAVVTESTTPQIVSVMAAEETEPVTTTPPTVAETETVETIPETTTEETVPKTAAAETVPETTSQSGPININTADQQTLMLLPGIGEVISQRIIDYRSENGPFGSTAELINIKGIGEKRLEALLPLVTVGG